MSNCVTGDLILGDWAGSECIKKSGVKGAHAKTTTGNINTTNLDLANVLRDNSDKKTPNFRNSKMTRFLQNTLGRGAKAVIIVNVWFK